MHHNLYFTEDSEDDKEDHKNVRQQRQAASKAASKQREMLMEDVGSEEEQEEEDEAPFQESMWSWRITLIILTLLLLMDAKFGRQVLQLFTRLLEETTIFLLNIYVIFCLDLGHT